MFAFKPSDTPPAIVTVQTNKICSDKFGSIAVIEDDPGINCYGQTSLHLAAAKKDRSWLRMLSAQKSTTELMRKDVFGSTPLHYAAQNAMLIEMLVNRDNIAELLSATDELGNTPLHIMAAKKCFDRSVLQRMPPKRAEDLLKIKNNQGETVFDVCIANKDRHLGVNLLGFISPDCPWRSEIASKLSKIY